MEYTTDIINDANCIRVFHESNCNSTSLFPAETFSFQNCYDVLLFEFVKRDNNKGKTKLKAPTKGVKKTI